MVGRRLHQLHASRGKGRARTDEQRVGPIVRKCRESRLDFLAAAGIEHSDLQSHGAPRCLRVSHRRLGCQMGRLTSTRCGYQLAQDFQVLGDKFAREKIVPCDIAARPREAGTQTSPDRILSDIEDDGDGRGGRLSRQRRLDPPPRRSQRPACGPVRSSALAAGASLSVDSHHDAS